jgi:hypothetical protein
VTTKIGVAIVVVVVYVLEREQMLSSLADVPCSCAMLKAPHARSISRSPGVKVLKNVAASGVIVVDVKVVTVTVDVLVAGVSVSVTVVVVQLHDSESWRLFKLEEIVYEEQLSKVQ